MLILDATTKSLKIVLAGAVATTQLPVTAHYTDITTTAYTPGSNDTVTNNTTVVEFVAAPAASTQRHVESISVYNVDTASATVTIQYVSAGGTRQIIKVVLLTLEALFYEDGTGWQIIDANGNIKHTFSGMVSDTAYAASWDSVAGVAPSKNAVYDKMETMAPLNSPALVTPALGTPASGVLTNATGLPAAGVVGTAAILGANTFTGSQNTAYATVASHATTSAIWAAAGNVINFTGIETLTDLPAAPQAGAQRTLICAGACVFTHAGAITVQGAATYTAAAGDVILVTATSTTTFNINVLNQASKPAILLAGTAGKTITVTENTSLAGPASVTIAGPVELATNAEALTGTDTARAVTPDDMKYVLDRRIPSFYGVTWDESADTYTRTGATAGQANAVTLADAFLPIQRRMRGCLLADAGTVNYYLSATDWTKKEDGATASVLTGADGQVMVQIPKFWYRYGYAGTTHTWEVSPVPLAGFEPHPAFYKDGAWVDYRYIGAYEGVLYDNSLTAYVDGIYQTAVSCVFDTSDDSMTIATRSNWATNLTVGQKIVVSGTTNNNGTKTVASLVSGTKITVSENLTDETHAATVISTERDYTTTTGDKLSSVSGKAAINYLTRANLRVIALNRGAGWRQQDYDLIQAIQLLFITEYASFYSQSVLGAGISNVTDWPAYNDYNPLALSGNGNSIGNASGNNAGSASAATESTKYLKYRGIENFFGHLWKFVDGFNINNNIPYRTNVGANFADDTAANYTQMVNALGANVTLHNENGYPATIQKMKWGFLAASIGASGSTKITDYYWQAAGWRVALFGGPSHDGVCDGAFGWHLSYASGFVSRNIVGRVGF